MSDPEPTDPRAPVQALPIGVVRSPYKERFGTPRQGTVTVGVLGDGPQEARIELFPDRVPAEVLRGVEGFQYVWIVAWLDRNQGWRPTVIPTRGPRVRRGLFATRSPHRPNAIGLTASEVVAVEGHTLVVRGIDLLDGTPVLDLKPYVPYADAFPQARAGWLDELDEPGNSPDRPTRPRGRRWREGGDQGEG